MKLLSAGAALTVTGSCHRIEARGRRILVDCGLFQGPQEIAKLNRESFPFEPGEIDAVLLTHGHLDHCGRLPLLVERGFRGPIYCTRSTRSITEIILNDAAKLQQEDWERALRKAGSKPREADDIEPPLYVPGDIPQTLSQFREASFDQSIDLGAGVSAVFRPAGHILGSAFVQIETPDGRVVASGDLGNRESAIQEPAVLPPECDAVIVETTYGDRTHRSLADTLEEFRTVIRKAVEAGGVVMIPSFALERAQVVLFHLNAMMREQRIPEVDVFVDSPMAARMTRLYQDSANEFKDPIAAELAAGRDPFEPPTLKFTVATEESKKLNDLDCCAIIVAGAGMMTGGRILHHLRNQLHKPQASLVIVGYQSQGTLGRRLVDGAKHVRIYGTEIDVEASVHTINGLSAHADQDDLLRWLEGTGKAHAWLVHGEPPVMKSFAGLLASRGRDSTLVERGREYELR
ncbi:MAG TPA: MBL fold metallo-hydrolase [Gemmatimonadota bacterium]|nr:MBL fold metallo-hydrolase [Gemmatimonadota bacterium]